MAWLLISFGNYVRISYTGRGISPLLLGGSNGDLRHYGLVLHGSGLGFRTRTGTYPNSATDPAATWKNIRISQV